MNSRPIIFSAPMVRAILAGKKSQTRRIIKLNDAGRVEKGGRQWHVEDGSAVIACPYGSAGDHLWLRETWCPTYAQDPTYNEGEPIGIDYRATPTKRMSDYLGTRKWRPSIFMPRKFSRITLEITDVRLQRLDEISPEDAAAEGWPGADEKNSIRSAYPTAWFAHLWDSINGKKHPWDSNPYVWAITFKRIAAQRIGDNYAVS